MTPTPILVVEDEGIIALDIQRQLLDLGYGPVDIAATAESAVAMAGAGRPRLVLMDIHLGSGMDGIDAAIDIRRQFSIPCIFLTAYATDEVVARAKAAEPLGYIIKPFTEQGLRTTVEIALYKQQTEEQLRRSERRYRAVVESARDAIVTIDSAGRVAGWSPAATRLSGYAEADVIDTPAAALIPERLRAAFLDSLARLREGAPLPDRLWERATVLRADGREVPVEMSVARWDTDEGWFLTCVLRDVTERAAAEATLRLQVAALNATANAMVITDRQGTIEWVNPAFSTLTGFTAAESVGRNMRDLVRSGQHDRAFYEHMWETLEAGLVWQGEFVNRRRDGSIYAEEQTITPVRDGSGAISHFIGVKRDLTEQRRMQQQFLEAQKMEVVGRLAGGVAHDFNNILTVITGTVELALMELPDGHPLRADFDQIREASDQAARITRQLLAFSRRQVLAPVVLNLATHVEGSAKILHRLIGEDINLLIQSPLPVDNVRIDPGHLEQVLLNLAVNARDAMPGGGTLTIETRNVMVGPSQAADQPGLQIGPHVALTVRDSGVGMSAELQARIFEPFYTTKEPGKGTGLGLATVFGIVSQSGGVVQVQSEPGRGASFTILFPSVPDGATGTLASRAMRTSRGTETVLLAEDDESLRLLTARMLRHAGYTVLPAANGGEALALAAAHDGPVHVLITDVVMPSMGGPDLAVQMQSRQPGLPVLYTSGYTDDAMLRAGALDGTRHFLPKPFTVTELTRKVREVLTGEERRYS
jgi:two-component system, cell cycle sensor histidine kinase and response regulator CckA